MKMPSVAKFYSFSPLKIFITLSVLFLLFSFSIYLKPLRNKELRNLSTQTHVSAGKEVWQQNNCHTCHQMYGLGGYLGPDLTNIMSKPGRTDAYIKGIITSGVKQMPAFQLSDKELTDLLFFLKAMNETGTANPTDYQININGTYTLKK